MKVADKFSICNGATYFAEHYPKELAEVMKVIAAIDIDTIPKTPLKYHEGFRLVHHKPALNAAFAREFEKRGWVKDMRGVGMYTIDFGKNRVGVEVQLSNRVFPVSDLQKMARFRREKVLDCGIVIVPTIAMGWQLATFALTKRMLEESDKPRTPALILGIKTPMPTKVDK